MSKGKDEGIGKICLSKPTWFDSRAAIRSFVIDGINVGLEGGAGKNNL
jgi:hypothetical protein